MYGFRKTCEPSIVGYHSMKNGFPQMPIVQGWLNLEEVPGKDGLVPVITFISLVPTSIKVDEAARIVEDLKSEMIHGLEFPDRFLYRWDGFGDKNVVNLVNVGRTHPKWMRVDRPPVVGGDDIQIPACLRDNGIREG